MDFRLTEDQLMIQATARDFAQREIVPIAAAFDESGEFPLETVRKMGELGLMGIEVPHEYQGAGLDTIGYCLALMEVSQADASHGTIMSVNNSLYANGLMRFGTEAQRQQWLVPIANGAQIGAYALTEPQSGSDASSMRCRAVASADGSSYTINGSKTWITSGPYADKLVLFASTNPERGASGITAFMVDTHKPGFSRGKKEPKLGIRASATCQIEFTDYQLEADCVLGKEGEGFKIAMSVLDAGRIGIAAQALGIARAAYEAAVQYSRDRKAFGASIGSFQAIQAKIADMKCRIDASYLLMLRAAWLKTQAATSGQRYTTESSVAKLYASETAMYVTHQALQIHGGMGYSKELPIERYFRDAKITEIYEGTSEIQRMVIGRNETGLR